LAKVADELGIESVLGINPKVSNVVELEPELQVESLCNTEPVDTEPVDANVNEKCLVSRAGSAIVDTKVTCLCGSQVTQKSMGKHVKTAKHLKVCPVEFDGI